MKISKNQMFNKGNNWLIALMSALFILSVQSTTAQEGEALFNSKCATCHQPHKDMTGPKLFEVRQKWEQNGAKEGSIYQWVQNWQVAAANDPYAKEIAQWSPTAMSVFPDLSKEQIDAIFDYVDAQPDPSTVEADGGAGAGVATDVAEEESSLGWIWYILAIVFIVIILSVGGVRRQLKNLDEEGEYKMTYADEIKTWIFRNRKVVGLGVLVLVIALIVGILLRLGEIGVVTAYQPSQPIAFPHDIHAGKNGIDCKYCHNSADKSKSAGIPTVNVCMNCHKQIQGSGDQVAKIQKIYDAAGFSPEGGGLYSPAETSNIVWNKVHVLPDHVYFSHQQHVVVGGVDCKQCHGDMTKQKEVARVVPVEELNKIEGNVQLTKPTLTMGWCIECHGEKEIANGPIEGKGGYYDEIHKRLLENDESLYEDYLKDGKVTVKELGGWECAKCHY